MLLFSSVAPILRMENRLPDENSHVLFLPFLLTYLSSLLFLHAQLVIDNGSGMCKAGFAGDDAPRAVSILLAFSSALPTFFPDFLDYIGFPIHCGSSPSPRCDGWYGTKRLIRW